MPRVVRNAKKVGERPGKRSKHYPITTKDNGSTDYNHNYGLRLNVLYAFSCTDVPVSSTPFDPITRNGHSINLRGIKIKLVVRNDAAFRVTLNYALVSMKNSRGNIAGIGTNEGLIGGATMTKDFFRSNIQKRDENFDQANLTGMQMASLPINSDIYNIHFRKRLVLGEGIGASASGGDRSNLHIINRYFKINRRIDYDDEEGTNAETPIFFIYWFNKLLSNKGDGTDFFGIAQADCLSYFTDVAA